MEAAIRFAYEQLTNKTFEKLQFEEVRGCKGIKEASIDINGKISKTFTEKDEINMAKGVERAKNVPCINPLPEPACYTHQGAGRKKSV